jgi:AcrR family transcriptional regulator
MARTRPRPLDRMPARPRPRRVPAPRPERDRQGDIVSAAIAVFFRYGLHRVTMEDIAREAGVSRQTVYARFGNKERLFVAAASHMLDQSNAGARAALDAPGALWDRVLAAFEAQNVGHVRDLKKSEHAEELWGTVSTLLAPIVAAKERRMVAAIAAAVERARADGEVRLAPGITPRELAETMVLADAGFKSHDVTVPKYRARLRVLVELMRQATRA